MMNKENGTNARAHIIIGGRVQGVFFRSYTREKASSLGVRGWVHNRWDGNVEVVAEGEKEDVKKMIFFCEQGPPSAKIEKVDIDWETPTGEFSSFSVK